MDIKISTIKTLRAAFLAGLIAGPAMGQNFEAGVDLDYLGIAHSEGQTVGFGFTAAPELWVRFNAPSGLYYGLNAFRLSATSSDPATVYDKITMQTIDLTVGKAFSLGGNTRAKLYGGLRHAKYSERRSGGGGTLDVPKAWGVLAGFEVDQPLGDRFSLYGGSEAAILFAPDYTDGGATNQNLTFNTIDLDLGLKYGSDLANGRGWYASGGLTAKLWNGVSDDDSENTSAYGFKLSVGMNF